MKDALPWLLGGGALLALFYFYKQANPTPGGYVPGATPPPGLPPGTTTPATLPEGNVWGALQGLFGMADTAIDKYGGSSPQAPAGAPTPPPVIQTYDDPGSLGSWFDD